MRCVGVNCVSFIQLKEIALNSSAKNGFMANQAVKEQNPKYHFAHVGVSDVAFQSDISGDKDAGRATGRIILRMTGYGGASVHAAVARNGQVTYFRYWS